MPKNHELLNTAIEETLSLIIEIQNNEKAGYDLWHQSPRSSPLPPSISAGPGSRGSYPTTMAALGALKEISDGLLQNQKNLKRTITRDSAYKVAAEVFGAMLEKLFEDLKQEQSNDPSVTDSSVGDIRRWKMYRTELNNRLSQGLMTITHYVPVWLVVRQAMPAFTIGPIQFMGREAWHDEVQKRQGTPFSWGSQVKDVWSGAIKIDEIVDFHAQQMAKAVHPEQMVAVVTISGFEQSASSNRALLAVRIALDALRIILPSPHNANISTAADHGPPIMVKRFLQADGFRLSEGSSLNLQGVGGAPGFAEELLTNNQDYLIAVGRYIEANIAADTANNSFSCPTLSEKWINAAHWFGRACRADEDFVALTMFAIAMDILSGGLQDEGICELATKLFELDENAIFFTKLGISLRKAVETTYKWRSQIAHGSELAIDKDLSDERKQAAVIAANLIGCYALKLDVYSSTGGKDDRDAFRVWLTTYKTPQKLKSPTM